ncbi:MAG TPA: hypothetical protein DCS29_01780 [Candidatus Magasanikbacteria bacterium]|nr:MAG: hypothetical protein A2479_01350 [Candidatus Magasanikbacteria bacterium RIFOXYC2_FULL_39_8]HAT03487.1 hypothetical protein [Candidatus Magasanikbacteria bacterium]
MSKFRVVIFDMDGLMIDSEPVHSKAFERVFEECDKIPNLDTEGMVDYVIGIRDKDNWQLLKDRYGFVEDVDYLVERRRKIYLELLEKSIQLREGFRELFDTLKKNDTRLAIASASPMEQVNIIVDKFGMRDDFDALVSADDLKESKPNPEVYLVTAKKLAVSPENCVVMEDTQTGVESGRNAGMRVIVVPSQYTKDQDFSKADLVANSLEDKKIYSFLGIG